VNPADQRGASPGAGQDIARPRTMHSWTSAPGSGPCPWCRPRLRSTMLVDRLHRAGHETTGRPGSHVRVARLRGITSTIPGAPSQVRQERVHASRAGVPALQALAGSNGGLAGLPARPRPPWGSERPPRSPPGGKYGRLRASQALAGLSSGQRITGRHAWREAPFWGVRRNLNAPCELREEPKPSPLSTT
jgi:hypothetical protein